MADNKKDVKEIDLLELFQIIGRGIKNSFIGLLKAILFLIIFSIKKALWLALFVIIGGVIGFFFFSSTQRYYSSDLIAQPNGLTAVDMVQYINDLNHFSTKGDCRALADGLDISDSLAKQIKNIEAFYFLDVNKDKIGDFVDFTNTYNPSDTNIVIDNSRIYLQVEVYNNTIFDSVKKGLFNYVAKNPYLIKLKDIRVRELEELIALTLLEISKLDSLQNVDYFKQQTNLSQINDNKLLFFS